MSYLEFRSPAQPDSTSSEALKRSKQETTKGSIKRAFSDYVVKNHGDRYLEQLKQQRQKAKEGPKLQLDDTTPLVGIVGGGFAGMYAGLILQSLGLEFEIFEASDRVGGRIDTWYSKNYDPNNPDQACLYGEVGGMRVPQFSADMLPVQQLTIALNTVLTRNGLNDQLVNWRKFYYSSPVQRLRYNNMQAPIEAKDAGLNPLNFDAANGGDIAEVWLTPTSQGSSAPYLPINMILDKVNQPFIEAINESFKKGFEMLMQHDDHSMWSYLSNVFTLGDLGEYYQPAMGDKTDHLPYNVISYLETLNVGTGMYSVSFVEMVIAVYDWGGSKNPYDKADQNIYMVTVDKGMQHFPDACKTVLNLQDGVQITDGIAAQQLVGMIPGQNGQKGYSPSNLTADAAPPSTVPKADPIVPTPAPASAAKQRVFNNTKVNALRYDSNMYSGYGGMQVDLTDAQGTHTKNYPYVISTLPNGNYINGSLGGDFFQSLSFDKARALRECNYMPSFKAFITFHNQFWAKLGERQDAGLGVGTSDRPNRQIVYPSYGYEAQGGVLQIYCWAQDAERMGALGDQERVNECLKGIQYLYPEVDVLAAFAGYDPEITTKTWFWDNHAGGGAFALYKPGQFKNLYPSLLSPEFDGHLNLAGECCSVHHGWIVGALDSGYNAVFNILKQMNREDLISQMQETWGVLSYPDIDSKEKQTQQLSAYLS
ncbi:FAD-dependent oxidoreductase [Gilvibacter sp.]|uniref:flavin monoamine oxidase family protein n=1 Tax=Gilvibacter sp. TaxID=2729997 RepID=UPI003F4A24DB